MVTAVRDSYLVSTIVSDYSVRMRSVSLATFVVLIAVGVSFGCSKMPIQLVQVSSQLRITITHRGAAIAGIPVRVTREGEAAAEVFSASTDEHGAVVTGILPVGRYYLVATYLGFEAGEEWIEVVAGRSETAKSEFAFRWADDTYVVHRVDGSLSGLVPGNSGNALQNLLHPVETVYSGVRVTLKSAFSDPTYSTISDSTGRFIIDPVPDGIYLLTIEGGMMSVSGRGADETTAIVDVSHSAASGFLPMRLKDTGCYQVEFTASND